MRHIQDESCKTFFLHPLFLAQLFKNFFLFIFLVLSHQSNQNNRKEAINEGKSICETLLILLAYLFFVCTLPFSLCYALKVIKHYISNNVIFIVKLFLNFKFIKIVNEYERAVIFRLGRILKGGAKGPGLFFILPCVDTISKVDLRTVSYDVTLNSRSNFLKTKYINFKLK